VEHEEWMSAQVRQELEEYERTHGLVGEEAVAFWHLAEARRLMSGLVIVDTDKLLRHREKKYEAEGLNVGELTGRVMADGAFFTSVTQTNLMSHFDALGAVLGRRVLRRSYPEWNRELSEAEADEADNGG
jgi:hypothetical protein